MSIEQKIEENTKALSVLADVIRTYLKEDSAPIVAEVSEVATEERPTNLKELVNTLITNLIVQDKRDAMIKVMHAAGLKGRGAIDNATEDQLKAALVALKNVA